MNPFNDRSLANASLILLLAIGLVLLALLVLAPDYVQAGLDGLQPVSLQSGLQANYAVDPRGLAIQPLALKAVEQSIADRTTSTISSRQQAAAAIAALTTPVFTVTPMQSRTQLTAGSPISTQPTLKSTAIANTSTRQVVHSASATPTGILANSTATLPPIVTLSNPGSTSTKKPVIPTKTVFSPTPNLGIATLQPTKTLTSTKPPVVISSTWTALPSKTNTWTPKPPAITPTATPKPPTRTNTPASYPPPATKTTLPPYP